MNNTTLDSTCLLAYQIANSSTYRYLILCKALISVIAVGCILALICSHGTKWLVHPNARVVHAIHLMWLLETPLSYVIIYFYDFYRLSITEEPCGYRISAVLSLNIRTLSTVGIVGQICAMLAFAIERLFATISPQSYEKIQTSFIGWILAIISIIVAFGLTYGLTFKNVKWNQLLATFTTRTNENKDDFQLMVWLELSLECCSICIFIFIVVLNGTMKTKSWIGRLAEKYQIHENRKISKHLFPVFCIHFLFIFPTIFGLAIYPWLFPNGTPVTQSIYLEVVAQHSVYCIILTAMLHPSSPFARRKAKSTVVDSHLAQDQYFKQLSILFEKGEDL